MGPSATATGTKIKASSRPPERGVATRCYEFMKVFLIERSQQDQIVIPKGITYQDLNVDWDCSKSLPTRGVMKSPTRNLSK